MRPVFSIIVPTYNSEATLSICLESIVNQSYNCFEVVIVDGVSQDGTIEIAKKYQAKFRKIRIYSEKDNGIYDAMNKGIDLAIGSWLFFMGSDDTFFDKGVLKKIAETIEQNNIDIVYGSICSSKYGSCYDGEFTYDKLAIKNIGHQAIFFSKKVFDVIGVFNVKYKATADWDHNIRWFFSSKIRKKHVDLIVANYADGGYSDQYADIDFSRDRYKILFTHGFFKLNRKNLLKITLVLMNNSKKNKQYANYLFYKITFLILTYLYRIKV